MLTENFLRSRRDATRRLIAENPVQVAITQTVLVADGAGGRIEQTRSLAPFAARLFSVRRVLRQVQEEAGKRQAKEWLLLAPSDAVVRADSSSDSRFVVNGKTYMIKEVLPRSYCREIYAQHIILEEVT